MSEYPIELEIRGEISARDIPRLRKKLVQLGFTPASTTRRTSLMSFGIVSAYHNALNEQKSDDVDVRCRITNGQAEIVAKVGKTSAANRVEMSVSVSSDDLFKFAKLFGALPFFNKVGSRVMENFERDNITVSLASSIPSKRSYIEIERMTTRVREASDLCVLRALARELNITLWETHQAFIDFCDLLTKYDDWSFVGNAADMKRLKADIKKTRSNQV